MLPLLSLFQHKAYLLLPLLAAMLYALGTLALKSSNSLGMDNNRTTFVCNVATALAFLGFYDWRNFPALPSPLWPLALLAVLFILGQLFTVLALTTGDVSSVTPVFGVKTVCVGILAAYVIGSRVSGLTWVGAVISVIGIACLQVSDKPRITKKQGSAILCALLASVSFAGFDAMTQYWSPILGFGNFVPPALVLAALLSAVILPRKGAPWRELSGRALGHLAAGVALFTLQSLVLIRSIGAFGDAAGANVVYSSRGVWGIVFVWLLGHWFNNRELHAAPRHVLWARFTGAALVSIATVLVFL